MEQVQLPMIFTLLAFLATAAIVSLVMTLVATPITGVATYMVASKYKRKKKWAAITLLGTYPYLMSFASNKHSVAYAVCMLLAIISLGFTTPIPLVVSMVAMHTVYMLAMRQIFSGRPLSWCMATLFPCITSLLLCNTYLSKQEGDN